jgi:hypothetical protein
MPAPTTITSTLLLVLTGLLLVLIGLLTVPSRCDTTLSGLAAAGFGASAEETVPVSDKCRRPYREYIREVPHYEW